ncbi:MAG TPA: hypothetical protein VKN36_11145, partial [Eudoraea sp.]|nr:hypothetical protein [Eudoraea sp.]
MKKIVLVAVATAFACNTSQKMVLSPAAAEQVEAGVTTYAETITESELKDYLFTYASDEFEGRETGKAGQKKAVEYL